MTAKEMFEAMGFTKNEGGDCRFVKYYRREPQINDDGLESERLLEVIFCPRTKEFQVTLGFFDSYPVDMKLLQAINKQWEELGVIE